MPDLGDTERKLSCDMGAGKSVSPAQEDCINVILTMPQSHDQFTIHNRSPLLVDETVGRCRLFSMCSFLIPAIAPRMLILGDRLVALRYGSEEKTSWNFLYTAAMLFMNGCNRSDKRVNPGMMLTGPHARIIVKFSKTPGPDDDAVGTNVTALETAAPSR